MNHDFPSFKKSLDIIKITDPETIKKYSTDYLMMGF